MTPLLVSYIVLVSMAALVAGHHALMGLRRPDLTIHRQFAALAAMLAVHGLLMLPRFEERSLDRLLDLSWAMWLCEVAVLWLLTGFIKHFTERPHDRFARGVSWVCLGLVILHLIRIPAGFAHSEILGVESRSTVGDERVWVIQATLSWAYYVFAVLCLAVLVWGMGCAWRYARAGQAQRGYALLAALALATLAVLNSLIFFDILDWSTIQVIDHSFVGFVILMSLIMSDEVVQSGRLQRELAAREADLSSTLDAITDGVVTVDHRAMIVRSNPAARELVAARGDPVGRPVAEAFQVQDRLDGSPAELPIRNLLDGGSCQLAEPLTLVGNQAGPRAVQIAGAPVRGSDGAIIGAVLVIRDVTERLELETQLLQSRKMDALGQLAGGIAHDFNNMLTGIMGGAELMMTQFGPGQSELREQAEMISSSADRAAELTQQLLAFARRGKLVNRAMSVHECIESALALFRGGSAGGITMTLALHADHDVVRGDAAMFQNVILNLLVNARDAMPGGGNLAITTAKRSSGSNQQVEVVVVDDGAGMPQEICERIFEPFFTTKQEGSGTGLGLAAVYGTIQAMGGSIRCESEVGRGTIFTILLPAATGQAAASRRFRVPARGQGRILVVDDDDVVRITTEAMLKSLGYLVDAVASGPEAIDRFGDGSGYDLVVLDVVMPGMSGDVVYGHLRRRCPKLRCVVVSGYTRDASIDQMREEGVAVVLNKPFRLDDLSAGVRRALAGD